MTQRKRTEATRIVAISLGFIVYSAISASGRGVLAAVLYLTLLAILYWRAHGRR